MCEPNNFNKVCLAVGNDKYMSIWRVDKQINLIFPWNSIVKKS